MNQNQIVNKLITNKKHIVIAILIVVFLIGAFIIRSRTTVDSKSKEIKVADIPTEDTLSYDIPVADGFDFPVGKPDAEDYHDLQPFRENNHLGEDWNDMGPCDNDLGDPIYSIGDGVVVFADDIGGGWGNIVRVVHKLEQNPDKYVEALYAHFEEVDVKKDQLVKRGDKIGTIGNVSGKYCAHLHLELRSKVGMPVGGGYAKDAEGFVSPTDFINSNRPKDNI